MPRVKQSGWIEIMGAGMVTRRFVQMAGDSEAVTGYAFGMELSGWR